MDSGDIERRIKRLIAELDLIDSFERLYTEDESSEYHVQIGKRARQLRCAEIEIELRYLEANLRSPAN